MNGQKIFLKPFSLLYGFIQDTRNFLYERSILASSTTPQFSIVVGNLTVGGTGKTPMIEYLIQLLRGEYQLVTLSRGYGRKSRGFQLASSNSTAEDIGDEPLQYYEKFGNFCHVSVSENRTKGSKELFRLFPGYRVLLLDDAFQHRALRPNLSLVLNDYNRPFYKDAPFPGGRLRETRKGAGRADAIITTKCPENLSEGQKESIRSEIGRYSAPGTPVFFSKLRYGPFTNFENTEIPAETVTLVAGIAQPGPFVDHVRNHYHLIEERIFRDHHSYTMDDLEEMVSGVGTQGFIVTTEKDKVKLMPLAQNANVLSKFGYIQIQVDFGSETLEFNEWLLNHVKVATSKTDY